MKQKTWDCTLQSSCHLNNCNSDNKAQNSTDPEQSEKRGACKQEVKTYTLRTVVDFCSPCSLGGACTPFWRLLKISWLLLSINGESHLRTTILYRQEMGLLSSTAENSSSQFLHMWLCSEASLVGRSCQSQTAMAIPSHIDTTGLVCKGTTRRQHNWNWAVTM